MNMPFPVEESNIVYIMGDREVGKTNLVKR